jgi:hypothetical protein
LHPWCCTVVQLHLSSSLIPDLALFVICANFSFLYARRKQHDADQSARGELYWIYIPLYLCPIIQSILCTILLRPCIYFLYIFLCIVRIFWVRPYRPVRFLESYTKFFKNMGCLYFLESFLNFQSPCEIGFSIFSFYRELFVFFYFKTTLHHTDSDGLV